MVILIWTVCVNSHHGSEGQRTRRLRGQGQPFLPGGVWVGHEGGHAPTVCFTAE